MDFWKSYCGCDGDCVKGRCTLFKYVASGVLTPDELAGVEQAAENILKLGISPKDAMSARGNLAKLIACHREHTDYNGSNGSYLPQTPL